LRRCALVYNSPKRRASAKGHFRRFFYFFVRNKEYRSFDPDAI
jgi:hypothetical protein